MECHSEISSLDLIIAFRNRIIHGYDSVDEIIVWNAIQNSVPALRLEVQKLLGWKLEVTPLERALLEKFVANTAEAAVKTSEKK